MEFIAQCVCGNKRILPDPNLTIKSALEKISLLVCSKCKNPVSHLLDNADSTRHCNFTHGMMREAAMLKCFSPSKVKEHECKPITASLRVRSFNVLTRTHQAIFSLFLRLISVINHLHLHHGNTSATIIQHA